ncbi:ovomucoid-like isoform X2 [Pelodiscus sinensis]|uniref:ovomucoid-like isoform X2 n=1 Tax=Pelodiscus sinensis TaxID=13735 RepID=UPI003F6AD115
MEQMIKQSVCKYLEDEEVTNAAGQRGKGFCSEYSAPPQVCTMEYSPICGTDGKTYSNKCYFCAASLGQRGRLRAAYYGKC